MHGGRNVPWTMYDRMRNVSWSGMKMYCGRGQYVEWNEDVLWSWEMCGVKFVDVGNVWSEICGRGKCVVWSGMKMYCGRGQYVEWNEDALWS
ncbi:hypothetical protein AVEN_19170-1 [Araneus ventricosus]|uniref:Uncharacterized protein n=1 Tax=Araneus ventricosus TaxID=182803 RepID=A0A4Y2RAE9_ARAVE|nr:hypothetical protein AVEN_19170-1 [Araneus ventricosus]